MNDMTTTRMMLTTAVLAAVAALFAGSANAVLLDVEGGSGSGAPAVVTIEPGTIPYLSHGIGVDESQFSGLARDTAAASTSTVEPGTIPYLSHGIGVDESQFSGLQSSRFTGTWPGRVAPAMPEGLTGDSALTRVDLQAGTATGGSTSTGGETDWTWIGLGAGMAALLAAALMGLYFSARQRGRVALP